MRVDSTKVWAVMLEYWYVGVPLNDKGGDTMDITQQYTHNLICHHFAKEKSGRWWINTIGIYEGCIRRIATWKSSITHAKDGILQKVQYVGTISFCFHIMAYSMASIHKTYNIQIAMNMRKDIVEDRNECMHMADTRIFIWANTCHLTFVDRHAMSK